MGIQNQSTFLASELSESVYVELLRKEVRQEIEILKGRLLAIERRLEDPFG